MLKEKKELVEYLRSRCNSLVFNQEKLNEITTQYETESGSGFRYFVDGSDVDTNGWFDGIVECVRGEDQFGTEYGFFDNKGKCLVCIGVLKV